MAAEPPSDAARQNAARPDAPDRGQAPEGRGRLPGWRVTPAPDGRGRKGGGPGPPSGPTVRWLVILAVLGVLALNFWISSQALKPASRVQVPYSPTFLQQVESDNVVYSAIRGMLSTLDPHSSFFSPVEYARMRERQEGRYYGLGIQSG